MNTQKVTRLFSLITIVLLLGTSSAIAKKMPQISHEGLERVKKDGSADYVYLHPEADFSGYSKIMLDEPEISFQRFWKQTVNSQRTFDRITDSDIAKMIEQGKKLLIEEFTEAMKKADLTLVEEAGGDVLRVGASISKLNIKAPDPQKTAGSWSRIYAESAGDATLTIELYDSITGQILARAIDTKIDVGETVGWQQPRDHYSNVRDARQALGAWARQLAKGLQRALEEGEK
ncbi:DUF3313 domain-containing protein [Puniceicoccaceae bacterium K14]|nr:DUF3313 domain-containing protein [Puniceicoccaceae bacterium K14]